jgi:hypothetical protein
LNRYLSLKKRNAYKQIPQEKTPVSVPVGKTLADLREYEGAVSHLRAVAHGKCRAEEVVSRVSKECYVPIHVLSKRSKGKLRDKATTFYRCCGSRKTFVTLTFIEAVGDIEAVGILNKFFTQLREDFGSSFKYLWVAERQKKNHRYPGNIHFHVIVNKFLPVQKYNSLWVLQQYNAGLMYCSADGRYTTFEEVTERITNKTLQEVLNPFDVERVKSIYGLSYYLTKYITKNNSDGFKCLAWHCSRQVSRLFTKTVISRSTFRGIESFINTRVDRATGEVVKAKCYQGRFHIMYYVENKRYFLQYMNELEQVNKWILEGMQLDRSPDITDFDIGKFYNN